MVRKDRDRSSFAADREVWIWCATHNKRAYPGRKAAKAVIRSLHEADGMREYRCDALVDRWHVGHMPPVVRQGRLTVREVYRDAAEAS